MTRMKCPPTDEERDARETARHVLDKLQIAQFLMGEATGLLRCLPDTRAHEPLQRVASELHDAIQELWGNVDVCRRSLPVPPLVTHCPVCGAKLRGDGSCCDACDWTKP